MYKNQNVLVTGGTGLVGRELVELLVNLNANITSVSLDDNNFDPSWNINYIKADLRNTQTCFDICQNKDYIFHIAGIKGSPIITKTKQYTFFTSLIQMNTNMIAAMYYSNIKWGLYTSTVGTYGPAKVFKENELWNQNPSPNDWFAGWAKRMGEVQIDAFEKQYNKRNISIIKPVNIYGKYDNFDLRTSTLVPSLIRKVYEATDTIEVWGDGSAGRDIIHAKDVARSAIFMVQNQITEPLNIGNGKNITIKELIQKIIQTSNKNLTIIYDTNKPKGDSLRVADVTKLTNYGFKTTISLEEGLKDTYQWYSKNHNYKGRFDPFLTRDYTNV